MRTTTLDDLAPVIGYRATRIIALWYAGRTLKVPTTPALGGRLVRLVGAPAARALAREFCGDEIAIPTGEDEDNYRRDQQIARWLAEGDTCGDIAARVGLTLRRVEQLRADLLARGWIEFAGRARRAGRAGRGRASYRLENLGTREDSDEPPPPSAAAAGG